jgi:IS5 family transposase
LSKARPAEHTLITADAGYHSDENMAKLKKMGIAAMVADNQMRSRDERMAGQGKHKSKGDALYQKGAPGEPKEVKRFTPA